MADQYSINYLVKATDQAGKVLAGISTQFQRLKNAASETYLKLNTPLKGGGVFGGKGGAGGLGQMARRLAAPIAGAMSLNAVMEQTMKFETAMSKIASRMPEDLTKVNTLGREIQELAVKTGRSTDDLGAGMFELVENFEKAGSPELAARLKSSMNLAKLGFSDTATSAQFLSHIAQAYNRNTVEDFDKIGASAFKSLKKSDVSLEEFSGTISALLPNAKTLGISVEELFATFSTFAKGREQFAQVNTSINFMLRGLAKAGSSTQFGKKPTPLAQIILGLGYRSGAELLHAKGFAGAIDLIIQRAKAMDIPLQSIIGGGRGTFFAMRLAAEGTKGLRKEMEGMPDDIEKAKMAVAAIDQVAATTRGWEKLKAVTSVTAQNIGRIISPALIQLFEAVNSPLKHVASKSAAADLMTYAGKEYHERFERTLGKTFAEFTKTEAGRDYLKTYSPAYAQAQKFIAENLPEEKPPSEQVLKIVLPTDDQGNPLISFARLTGSMKLKNVNGVPLLLQSPGGH